MPTVTKSFKSTDEANLAATTSNESFIITRSVDAADDTLDMKGAHDKVELRGDGNELSIANVETVQGSTGSDIVTVTDTNLASINLGADEDTLIFVGSSTVSVANVETIGVDDDTANKDNTITFTAITKGVEVHLGAGDDIVNLGKFANNVFIEGVESVIGNTGADIVTADDNLDGTIIKLAGGNDKLFLLDGGNTVNVQDVETVTGGDGDDLVTVLTVQKAGLFNLGDSGGDSLTLADGVNNVSVKGVEIINGGTGDDTITFSARVTGATIDLDAAAHGDKVVLGNFTNLISVTGVETVTGGTGADTVVLKTATAGQAATGVFNLGSSKSSPDTFVDTLDLSTTSDGSNVTVSGVESIVGSASDDVVTFTDLVKGLTIDLGGSGSDSDQVVLGKLGGTLSVVDVELVTGGAGIDKVTFLEGVAAGTVANLGKGADTVILKDMESDGTTAITANEITVSGVETITSVDTGVGAADTVTLTDASTKGTIDLGDGVDVLNLTGSSGLVVKNVETINGDNTAKEDVTITLDTSVTVTTVDLGTGAGDSLSIAAGGSATNTINVTDVETITGKGADDTVVVNSSLATTIDLNAGTNTLYIDDASVGALSVKNVSAIHGGTGADSVTMLAGATGTTIDLGGATSGNDVLTLFGANNSINVATAEDLSIVGGKASDVITLTGDGSGVISFNGGLGVDTIDLSALTGDTAVSVQNIESILGSGNADTVTFLAAQTGALKIDLGVGADTLDLNGFAISATVYGVETINAGTDPSDPTTDSANQSITFGDLLGGGAIDLGGGSDTVTFSAGSGTDSTAGTVTISNVETIKGGALSDVILVADNHAASVDLGGGSDTLLLDASVTLTVSNVETLTSTSNATSGDDVITLGVAATGVTVDLGGGDNGDTLTLGKGNNDLITVLNVETINGNTANDKVYLGGATVDALVDLKAGTDYLDLTNTTADTNVTMVGVESLLGGASSDVITLSGAYSAGSFDFGTVSGNADVDQLITDNLGATITEKNAESISGGTGIDKISISGATTLVTIDLGTGSGTEADTLILTTGGMSVSIQGVETVTGSSGADIVYLADAADGVAINLGAGTGDEVHTLDLGATIMISGVEAVTGGTGSDKVTFTAVTTGVTIDLKGDTDTLDTVTLFNGTNTNVTITQADIIHGGTGSDQVILNGATFTAASIDLGTGTDSLTFNTTDIYTVTVAGAETITGNSNDDTVVITDGGLYAKIDLLGDGTNGDVVDASAATNGLTVTLLNVESVVGSASDDVITYNAVAKAYLDLGAGDDKLTLLTSGANDVTILNIESIVGSAGDDTVTIDQTSTDAYEGWMNLGSGTGDTLVLGTAGNAITVTGVEHISVDASATGVDKITFGAAGTFGDSSNAIDLGGGSDKITLYATGTNEAYIKGVEQVTGGSGGDTIHVTDSVTEGVFNLGDGSDSLVLSLASTVTVGSVESVTTESTDVGNDVVTLKANYEGGTFDLGAGSSDQLIFSGAASSVTIANVESITGSIRDEEITVTGSVGFTGDLKGGNDIVHLVGGTYDITGGSGMDEFHFASGTPGGTYTIEDFESGSDVIVLDKNVVHDLHFLTGVTDFTSAGGADAAYVTDDGTDATLKIDTTGDGTADITITLKGLLAAGFDESDLAWS